MGAIDQTQVNSTDSKKDTTMSKRDAGKYAQWAGVGMQLGTKAIEASNTNNDPYAVKSDGKIESITGQLGPWGAAFTALSGLGASAGRKIGGGTDEYGHAKNKDDYRLGTSITSSFTPWATQKAIDNQKQYLTEDEKHQFGNTTAGQLLGGFIAPGIGADQKIKNQEAIAGRRETFTKANEANENAYKKSQKRINEGSKNYADAMVNAYYSVKVAKEGSVIEFKKYNRKRIVIEKSKVNTLTPIGSFKIGGVTKPKKSIIPKGAYHHTNNKLGDKGIPVVDKNGMKIFEIENIELILDKEISDRALDLTKLYNDTGDNKYLEEIGKITSEELIKNTYSYADEYSCLNNNSCSL